jgi:MGT family glycosyltransferase
MPTTPAFEYPRRRLERQVHFVGPLLPSPQAGYQRPSWWKDLDTKPVVHVTQGTYATDAVHLIRPTLDALADLDVLVLATTAQPDAIGAIPDNTRVERFIPHDVLLPHVDVMITNAGYNGVLAALAHGVPLVCAGLSEDKGNVAARVSWSGSGIDLRTDTPSATQVREGTESVLDNSSYRDNARRIQTDFARHHPAVEAADLLERLASTKEPVLTAGPS